MGKKKDLKEDFKAAKARALKGAGMLEGYADIPDANSLAHLLTEINGLRCEHIALVETLVRTNKINEIEYLHKRKTEMERLVRMLEMRLSEKIGSPVVL